MKAGNNKITCVGLHIISSALSFAILYKLKLSTIQDFSATVPVIQSRLSIQQGYGRTAALPRAMIFFGIYAKKSLTDAENGTARPDGQ